MKVYRSIPNCEDEKLAKSGFNYEAINLLNEGKVSPSFEYLNGSKNPNVSLNSFSSFNLAKYFYPNLYDALTWAYNQNQLYQLNKINLSFVIWEVDLPDFMLKENIGVGSYNNQTEHKLEIKVPYWQLASFLGLDLAENYLMAIKEFFQKHYSWQGTTEETKKAFLSQLKVDHIEPKIKDEIYAALCFKIFMAYQIMSTSEIEQIFKIITPKGIEYRQKIKELTYNYDHWATVGHGDINDYLYKEAQATKEENENLKRVLKREGYGFKRP